jgi:hypothetical protein
MHCYLVGRILSSAEVWAFVVRTLLFVLSRSTKPSGHYGDVRLSKVNIAKTHANVRVIGMNKSALRTNKHKLIQAPYRTILYCEQIAMIV